MNIEKLLSQFSELKIAVVGDLILDRYIDGVVERISPEAPVPVLKITGTRENPGGAGNVVENLKGLGCEVSFFHDTGNTIIKTRVMSGSQHILRIDDEDEPKWIKFEDLDIGLGYGIEQQKYNCVVISDYGKGVVSYDVAHEVISRCCIAGIPVVVDSKYNLDNFEGATVVKCNLNEWTPDQYMKKNFVDNLVITRGSKGMRYWGTHGGLELSGNIPGIETAICDPCGAGDTVIALLACMTAIGEPIDDACELANIAAAEVCSWPGVKAITKELLIKRFNEEHGSSIG